MESIVANLHRFAADVKAEAAKSHGGAGGSSGNSRVRDVLDPSKDLVIPSHQENASKEQFNAWKLALELRIECLPGCQNCGPILKEVRKQTETILDNVFQMILSKMTEDDLTVQSDLTHWEYTSRSLQLFLLLQSKLNRSTAKMCSHAIRDRNGFEIFRVVCREMEVEFEGLDFKLDLEIRDMSSR